MQYLPVISFILIICEGLSHILSAEAAQPYCYKNITETSHKVVTKTRLKTVNKKGFFNKLAQKKETQVETYEDYEPVYKTKVERMCCEGYKLTDLDMCEPQCIENGCPAHSNCVEPEVCECNSGYFSVRSPKDGKHYCEPICEKACPEHSVCVAPNECACRKGFHLTDTLKCAPYCASGCPYNGVCIAPNECRCSTGFKSEQGSCIPECISLGQCPSVWETSTYLADTTDQDPDAYATVMAVETDIDTYTDDIDPNQVFDEYLSSTTYYPEEDSTSVIVNHKCPVDFVYYKGECRPLKFASKEIDCRFKPCFDKHSYCLENGTCACNPGYQWFKIHVVDHDTLNQTIKSMCLTTAEYEARLQEENQENHEKSFSNWVTIFFVVLGVLVMVSALVYLGLKLLRPQTGQLDVEGKNLACSYDHRACTESEKSVI